LLLTLSLLTLLLLTQLLLLSNSRLNEQIERNAAGHPSGGCFLCLQILQVFSDFPDCPESPDFPDIPEKPDIPALPPQQKKSRWLCHRDFNVLINNNCLTAVNNYLLMFNE